MTLNGDEVKIVCALQEAITTIEDLKPSLYQVPISPFAVGKLNAIWGEIGDGIAALNAGLEHLRAARDQVYQ